VDRRDRIVERLAVDGVLARLDRLHDGVDEAGAIEPVVDPPLEVAERDPRPVDDHRRRGDTVADETEPARSARPAVGVGAVEHWRGDELTVDGGVALGTWVTGAVGGGRIGGDEDEHRGVPSFGLRYGARSPIWRPSGRRGVAEFAWCGRVAPRPTARPHSWCRVTH